MEVELLGGMEERGPGSLLQLVGRRPGQRRRESQRRREALLAAVDPDLQLCDLPREPLEPGLRALRGSVRHQQRQVAAGDPDQVELASVFLDHLHQLGQHLVAGARPEPGLERGQLVQREVRQGARPAAPADALDLLRQARLEGFLGQPAGDRIHNQAVMRHRTALEPDPHARAQLRGAQAQVRHVVRADLEGAQARGMIVREHQHRYPSALAIVAQPPEQPQHLGLREGGVAP
jgi:hypothetical protein